VTPGQGRVVGVVAAAGTGKSWLCAEFAGHCRARGIQMAEAHCPTIGKSVPFLPLLELLRNLFGIAGNDGAHEARRKIAGEVLLSGRDVHEIVPLVFDFLGVRDPDRAVPSLDPDARKGKLLAFVRHLVQARSAVASEVAVERLSVEQRGDGLEKVENLGYRSIRLPYDRS
jgi:predicted ATPase